MRKVLVVQLHRLGDVLQSTPALQALRISQPEDSISVLARSCFAEPLRGHPCVDELIEWDADAVIAASCNEDVPLSAQHAQIMDFAGRLQQARFDIAINLSNDMLSSMLVFLSGARETRGLTFRPDGGIAMPDAWTRQLFLVPTNRALNTINICDAFRGLAGAAHVPAAMSLPVSQADRDAARKILAGAEDAPLLVAMQPGASSASKRWPAERFAALANALTRRHGARIVIVGSASEAPLAQRLAALMDTPPVIATGRTSLRQLAALVERCDLLVSNDTATIHVAAAVATPAIVLSF
ncbi:MAG TPA: glycosyltransferase family 9 protein, partial [Candidatus Brocadiia bacterium]|nr:glycosyltransferase family 9 protein [Candidatus Brocadiia bacterium]